MVMTKQERKAKKLSVKAIQEMGFLYRLIDSYETVTEIIAYATSREELSEIVAGEKIKRGVHCDLITQEWIDCGKQWGGWHYGNNVYETKPRVFSNQFATI